MYASDITAQAVASASQRLGFELTYHTREQIQAARSVLDNIVNMERGGLKRNLAPDEQRFITNERSLCALDFRYYLTNYCYIINWRKEEELITPNVAQSMMLEIWGDLEREARAIHILQLKARRLGVSSLSELAIAHRVQFHKYSNAVVASADPNKSIVMADIIDFCWKRMPWWLLPKTTKIKNAMPVEFGELESGITIQAGNQFNGVARGATPNIYHVSEIASWVNAEDLIEASLLRAIIDTPNVFGIIEGTGEGKYTYLHNTWNKAKKEWPARRGRQMPVFLPWFVGTDIWPSPAERRNRPIPQGWIPSDKTIAHAEKARKYVLSNPLLFKHLAKSNSEWKMPKEQMWFREVEYESAKESKTLNKFLSEMCIAGDARVSTDKGIVRIDEAHNAQWTETGPVSAWLDQGEKEIVAIQTKGGRLLKTTPDHRLQLANGTWKQADELKAGDSVSLSPPVFSNGYYTARWDWSPVCEMSTVIDEDWGRFIGLFIGDGCWKEDGPSIACFSEDTDVITECSRLMTRIIGRSPIEAKRKGVRLVLVNSHNVRWREMLKNMGIIHHRVHKKENRNSGYIKKLAVPECIWRSPKSVVRAFLQGLFESDGHANTHAPQTTYFSKEPQLVREVQLLLLGFGINAAHKSAPKKSGSGHIYEGHCLRLNAENSDKFHEEVGFIGVRKRGAFKRTHRSKLGRNAIPITMTDEVVSVDPSGNARVYDLTIDGAHKFGANGIVSHNCGDDFEAFQSQNLPIIDPEIILSYQERTRQPIGVYTVVGPDIPQALVAPRRQWDFDKPTITIATRPVMPMFDVRYQLIPLRFEGYETFDPELKLLIWEQPEDGYTYGVGTDCAEGVGEDNACVNVLREATADRPPGQVAEWVSSHVTAFQLWPITLAIGCLYSTYARLAEKRVQCRQVIEAWTNGSALQHELQKRGWHHFHPWQYNDTRKSKPEGEVQRVGVYTNQWFRSNMMDMLLTCLSEEAIDLPSPYFVEELETLERLAGQKKIAAQYGMHDDRVLALGITLFSLHQNKPPQKQFARKRVEYVPGLQAEDGIAYPIWTPPMQALSIRPAMESKVQRGRGGRAELVRGLNNTMPKGYR